MVTTDSSRMKKSNKVLFDKSPPKKGFYHPSPRKCLTKIQKKTAIRTGQQNQDESDQFTSSRNSSANSILNKTKSEHDVDYEKQQVSEEEEQEEEVIHKKFGHKATCLADVVKSRILSSESTEESSVVEDEDSTWDSFDKILKQPSNYEKPLPIQQKANEILKSAKTLLASRNFNSDEDISFSNEQLIRETLDLKPDSILDNGCLLKGKNEEFHSGKTYFGLSSESPAKTKTDEPSTDSSDFLVSTEGLETNSSSEEISFQPSFVSLPDFPENNYCLNDYTTDLPLSEYWKSNLNDDILYQWRIKRRIQLARQHTRPAEKPSFRTRTDLFQHQQTSPEEKDKPQSTNLRWPWTTKPETNSLTVPNLKTSQFLQMGDSIQYPTTEEFCISHNASATTTNSLITKSQSSSSFLPSTLNHLENKAKPSLSDPSQINEDFSMVQQICPSQKSKVNVEVQTSLDDRITSDRPSNSFINPSVNCSDSLTQTPHHPNTREAGSESSSNPREKISKYHKYLVAEKPHCSNLGNSVTSSLSGGENQKPKNKTSKLEEFYHQRLDRNENLKKKKSPQIVKPKIPCDETLEKKTTSEQLNKIDSAFEDNQQKDLDCKSKDASSESPENLSTFPDSESSSSDEEFGSDLMLQHLRQKRSIFKEQLRFIDERLNILIASEKN